MAVFMNVADRTRIIANAGSKFMMKSEDAIVNVTERSEIRTSS